MGYLAIGVVLTFAWCAAALAASWLGVKAFGPKTYRANPSADAGRGVLYAFGAGMMPGAKESVRTHLVSWGVGVGFHLGTFSAFVILLLSLSDAPAPRALGWVLGSVALLGGACGIGLLLKRAASETMRSFSSPDDFLSNLLTTGFAGVAGLRALGVLLDPPLYTAAMALLLYLPIGKIRHCLFFFPTRYFFGSYFGRRGVLPPAKGDLRA